MPVSRKREIGRIISTRSDAGSTISWPLYSKISITLELPEYLRNIHDFLIWIRGDEIVTFSRKFLSEFFFFSFTGQWFQSLHKPIANDCLRTLGEHYRSGYEPRQTWNFHQLILVLLPDFPLEIWLKSQPLSSDLAEMMTRDTDNTGSRGGQ